jgi:hypothetical protein
LYQLPVGDTCASLTKPRGRGETPEYSAPHMSSMALDHALDTVAILQICLQRLKRKASK